MLPLKLPSPLYCAVILGCAPTLSAEVASVATPLRFTLPVPSVVAPSKNVTVPEGVPAPGALTDTVAVKVTLWPKTDGLGADVTLVVVSALLTTWFTVLDVLPLKFVSPL